MSDDLRTRKSRVMRKCARDQFTAGEVARICQTSPRTVSKWIDSGKLVGFRLPLSQDRRVSRKDLIAFARRYEVHSIFREFGITSEGWPVVLVVGLGAESIDPLKNEVDGHEIEVTFVANLFDAGIAIGDMPPLAVVVDSGLGRIEGEILARSIRLRCAPDVTLFWASSVALIPHNYDWGVRYEEIGSALKSWSRSRTP